MNDLQNMADYYRNHYGDETDLLITSLTKPCEKIALLNPWLSNEQLTDILVEAKPDVILGHTFFRLPVECKPRPIDGLLSHYFLDRSSVLAPLLLPLEPNMRVLDMCSAPGGKLLTMLSRMIPDVHFIANDVSRLRANRLKKVISDFGPENIRQFVTLTNKDAHFYGLKQAQQFDAVLLDAPCSSEGHVALNASLLKTFKGPQKSLPKRQYSLLAAALLATKPGGYVMYATCTINHDENQRVIERVLHKKKDMCALEKIESPLGENGAFGVTILPHHHSAGPAFLSLLRRI